MNHQRIHTLLREAAGLVAMSDHPESYSISCELMDLAHAGVGTKQELAYDLLQERALTRALFSVLTSRLSLSSGDDGIYEMNRVYQVRVEVSRAVIATARNPNDVLRYIRDELSTAIVQALTKLIAEAQAQDQPGSTSA